MRSIGKTLTKTHTSNAEEEIEIQDEVCNISNVKINITNIVRENNEIINPPTGTRIILLITGVCVGLISIFIFIKKFKLF